MPQAPARTSLATAKQPLEDRLRTQLGNTFVCYEVPTPSQVMLDPDATDKRIHLGRAWPDFVCQPCAGDASSHGVSQASEVTRERQHVDDVLPGEDAEKDAPAKYETPIEVLHGRPSRNSTAILDLRKASFPVLFSLSRNSGSERALSSSILSGASLMMRRDLVCCWQPAVHRSHSETQLGHFFPCIPGNATLCSQNRIKICCR